MRTDIKVIAIISYCRMSKAHTSAHPLFAPLGCIGIHSPHFVVIIEDWLNVGVVVGSCKALHRNYLLILIGKRKQQIRWCLTKWKRVLSKLA